ncbi:MAG: outer membrane protein transport protein [Pseudomonadales bacterium]|uniref:OmpP1/FadL family transporter n=1 Tax=Alcanivorax sp. P2S70 TaxID=1397527 RepID=UPI0003B47CA1|nr:outer membrane protein transport protein [Alcanivorax sp. P2S70]ERP89206.1 Ompp1/FadL/TodX family transporter [Alcanivorax sp. P2S70]MCG8439736.1 outer membrane protein transport protein [Pseudomonadales bacterium]
MKYSNKAVLAAAIAAASTQAMANGLALNEQSASSAGSAYAGRASTAANASTLFGNPAGMSRLERAEVSGGLAFIDASTDISDAEGQLAPGLPVSGTNDGDMVPFSTIPFGYYVTPISDKLHAGIGVYAPFGVESDYENGWQGRYEGVTSMVQVVTIQPTVSYAFNDRVSVGFGPTINHISGELTSNVPAAAFNPALAAMSDADVEIEGDDIAYGYNVGVLFGITDRLDWGLTYHSKVDYSLEGDTTISGTPAPVAPAIDGKYDAELDITMPESVDTSFSFQATDALALYAGATFTRWSRLEGIEVENSGVNAMFQSSFGTITEELEWEDTWSFAVGGAYQLNPKWVIRAGYAFDESPTNDQHRTVRIPVSDRDIYTLGAGWNVSDDLTLDAAYAYIDEEKGEVNQDTYSADFENSAHGLALQATYRF